MHAYMGVYIQLVSPMLTREIPRFALVEVDLGDGPRREAAVGDLLPQVVRDQLLVRRVEPEARRQALLLLLLRLSPSPSPSTTSCC